LEKIVQSWIAVYKPNENFEELRKQIKKQMILLLFKLFINSTNLKFLKIDTYKQINNLIVKVFAFEKNYLVKKLIISIINAQEKFKKFSLSGIDSWLEKIIKALQSQTNSLVSINLKCINISESSLISFAKFKNLENLVILNYSRLNIILYNDIEFKNLKRLYIKLSFNEYQYAKPEELTLEVLTQEVIVSIIKNCSNITHLNLKNYCPYYYDWIFKDFIQKLHITHLVIKFLYNTESDEESTYFLKNSKIKKMYKNMKKQKAIKIQNSKHLDIILNGLITPNNTNNKI
ncbi:21420_t:CDS:2, partial [Gigaspora margarita]